MAEVDILALLLFNFIIILATLYQNFSCFSDITLHELLRAGVIVVGIRDRSEPDPHILKERGENYLW